MARKSWPPAAKFAESLVPMLPMPMATVLSEIAIVVKPLVTRLLWSQGWAGPLGPRSSLAASQVSRHHRISVMRGHLPAPDHGRMDPAPALYTIRINGHLGAMMLSAFPAMVQQWQGAETVLTGLLPAGARLVKAFGTLSAPTLSAAARQEPERAVLFYAADDTAAGDLVAGLIRAGGYEPVRVGGLDQSIRIEMFGDLHEYGALGRAVTKSEALAAV